MNQIDDSQNGWSLIFLCWVISSIAMGGSLFFSEVMQFTPCILCWYQRLAMYPLVLIFLMGMLPLNKIVFKFALPFAVVGWLVAMYHNLLHWGIIPESASPCREGISCTDVWIDWFGFITIPFLSLISFTIILSLLAIFYRRYYK